MPNWTDPETGHSDMDEHLANEKKEPRKMRIPEDLSVETQKKICDQHVRHFTNLVERGKSGQRGIRVLECESYVATWQAGATALAAGQPLPADTRAEMVEAVFSGEVDTLMTPEELERFSAETVED